MDDDGGIELALSAGAPPGRLIIAARNLIAPALAQQRQQHPVPDRAALVAAEELDLGGQLGPHRDKALPVRRAVAQRVEHLPQRLAGKAEADLSGWAQLAGALFGDVDRFKPALAQLAEPGDREQARLVALGLQPVSALAATIEAAAPLRDDPFRAALTHGLE